MPSRPWKRPRREQPEPARFGRRPRRIAAVLLLLPAVACSGLRPRPAPQSPFTAADRPFLVTPIRGYPLLVPLRGEQEVVAAHRALVEMGMVDQAARSATEWLTADPGFHPAAVLQAAADFGLGRWQEAALRLEPVVAELPGYVAAQLLLGRAREKLQDLPAAVTAYAAVAGAESLAAASVLRLRPRAAEILGARIADAVARGRLDLARDALQQLEAWAPGDPVTLEATLAVGGAAGEPERALAAARRLAELAPEDATLAERLATLELEAGDAGRGLEILERLATERPDDPALAERLAEARFGWRLQLLPAHVRELRGRPALSRGDFATLVFWLFPSVRHGRAGGATIASDILDSPARREIARVINLGLLVVDPDLHLFHPARPITREEALAALLRLLQIQTPPATCVGSASAVGAAAPATCEAARRCGLIPEMADCLPTAPLSGEEAMNLARLGGGLLAEAGEGVGP